MILLKFRRYKASLNEETQTIGNVFSRFVLCVKLFSMSSMTCFPVPQRSCSYMARFLFSSQKTQTKVEFFKNKKVPKLTLRNPY